MRRIISDGVSTYVLLPLFGVQAFHHTMKIALGFQVAVQKTFDKSTV
jgi:hypothetical protein